MKPDLIIAGLRAAPGTRTQGFVRLADGPAGTLVRAPLIVINGAEDGPTLLAAAGVHGDDLNTVPMIWRLAEQVNPLELRGQLLLVPVVNPLAYEAGTHVTPADNATPSFPGDPTGTISQRMGHGLYTQVVVHADYVLDMHGGSKNATLACLASLDSGIEPAVYAVAQGMAEAFHPEVIVVHAPKAGAGGLSLAASRRGAPGVYLGLGQMGFNEVDTVRGVAGVINILRFLSLLPGSPQPAPAPPAYTITELYQRSPLGGAFEAAVGPGAVVTVGQRLGWLCDVFGQPIGEVVAQVDGVVDAIRNYPVVAAGDWVVSIARWPAPPERSAL